MPYRLHPSGYCVGFNESASDNLIAGKACIHCGRVAGHKYGCPALDDLPDYFLSGKSSRASLFNATAVLWSRSLVRSFITFTLPSISDNVYQRSIHSIYTGDVALTAKFSKVLEAYSLRIKRRTGCKPSYVWVSEAQMSRQEKFGGVGDLHFHLVIDEEYKDYGRGYKDCNGRWRFPFISAEHEIEIKWLQSLWCEHLGVDSVNCVHVDPLPDGINSIPSYLAKYLGKGSMRRIVSRRFSASRDLTKLKPITIPCRPGDAYQIQPSIKCLPPVSLINQQVKDFEGYKCITEYYSTSEVLKHYGSWMALESEYVGGAKGLAFDFSKEETGRRKADGIYRKFWDGATACLNTGVDVSAEIRPLTKKKKRSALSVKKSPAERADLFADDR